MNIVRTDPTVFPRPYSLVAKLLAYETGIQISEQNVRHIERAALRKLRLALEGDNQPKNGGQS